MNPEPSMLPEPDERLGEILAAWIEAAERGEAPDSAEWLARHASFAPELAQFLANRARLQEAAEPLRQAVRAMAAVAPSSRAPLCPMSQESTGALPAAEMIGRSVGEHDLLEAIGQGGMGLVYRARHRRLQRLVALKMLRANVLPEAGDVQRFRNEAEVLAQLDHPHIVPIHDVGEHEGRVYFSMKLIEGGGLDGQLERFRDDPKNAARLVAEVARAVHHAHQRGILHRDLKPSNILLDREGQPHVSDFGLSKRIESDGSLTQTGAIVGTPQYMAPEQTSGRKGAVTTATDVYGLGAVLYALLTSRPPFQGETVLETLEQVREREPEPPRLINPKVDRDLETICLKCLQKEPQRRYESAQAMAEDLERWLKGEPIQDRRIGWARRIWRWHRRNPFLASLTGLSVGLALTLLIGLPIGTYLLWKKEAETRDALEEVEKQRGVALANEAKAKTLQRQAQSHLDKAFNDMGSLLKALDRKELAEISGIDKVRQELAAIILRHYESYLDEHSADPEARHWTARAYGAVSDLQKDPRKRIEFQVKAVTISEALTREFPAETRYRQRLAHNRYGLGAKLVEQGLKPQATEQYRQAMEAFEAAARLAPDDVGLLNTLAWLLAQNDDPTLRNPARAVVLARKIVESDPHSMDHWDTLGVACYYAGLWGEAVIALEKGFALLEENGNRAAAHTSLRSDSKDAARSKFYLAIAYSRLGNVEKARFWYDNVVQWTDKNAPQNGELRRLRAEAADLLGIRQQPPVQDTHTSPQKK
jgi:serine/threonine-protein kinase